MYVLYPAVGCVIGLILAAPGSMHKALRSAGGVRHPLRSLMWVRVGTLGIYSVWPPPKTHWKAWKLERKIMRFAVDFVVINND